MNILILFNRPIIAHHGGVERVSTILAEQFRKMGNNVFYLCYSADNFDNDRQYFSDFQLFIKPDPDKNNFSASVSRILSDHNIDIVMDQVQLVDVCRTIKSLPNPPAIITVFHNQPFAQAGKTRITMKNYYPTSISGHLFRIMSLTFPFLGERYYIKGNRDFFSKALDCSDKFSLLSDKFIPRFLKYIGSVDESKLIAVNNPNTFDNYSVKHCYLKEKIILMVGRVYNLSKNMGDFVKMWKRIYQQNPEWSAIIVGDGPDLDRLKNYAKKHNLKRIEFTGNITDVAPFYEKASISCVTSILEGWGMVLPEAMSKGCVPVVYDSFEAVHDIIQNEKNGLIVPKFNMRALCKAVQSLIDENDKLNSMSHEAMKSIARFSPDIIAKNWIRIFKSLKD